MKVLTRIVLAFFVAHITCWGPAICFAQEQANPERDSWQCLLDGERAAETDVSTGGNFTGGLVGGLFLGFIGAGIAVFTIDEPRPALDSLPIEDVRSPCALAFIEGYGNQGKSKKQNAALVGGVVGTAILATSLFLLANGLEDLFE